MGDNIINFSEILAALQVIKLECSHHTRCDDCPLFLDNLCGLKYLDPEKWKLTSQPIWRAFK